MTDYVALDRESTARIIGRWFERVLSALLVLAVLALAQVVLDQRGRLDDLGSTNDELVDLLNGRTDIINHIDASVTRIECLIEKQSDVVVAIVVALLDDGNEQAIGDLRDAYGELQAALDGECQEEKP